MDLEFGRPIHFDYSLTVLRDNMKDYDITRVKLVCLLTPNHFTLLQLYWDMHFSFHFQI
jgi:hypothetical protein